MCVCVSQQHNVVSPNKRMWSLPTRVWCSHTPEPERTNPRASPYPPDPTHPTPPSWAILSPQGSVGLPFGSPLGLSWAILGTVWAVLGLS